MKKLSRVLSVLLIVAMILPGIAQAATLEAGDSIRIAGKDRYETSAIASELAYPEGSDTVVVATGRKYADALAGTVLARAKNAPLLLTHSDYLPKEVKAEIERLNAKKVIILGGTGAVGEDVEADLASFVADVSRINEADRYATAVAVAEKAVGKTAKKAYLVSGQVFKDALVIGPVAGKEMAPIFLTEGASLNETTEQALVDFGVEEVVIVGGNNAVADAVQTAVAGKGIAVSRTYGADAVATSLAVAENFANPSNVYVASAAKLADALVAGYLGAMNNGPVLLTSTADISEDVLAYISANDVEAHVMGGNAVVSDAIVEKVEKAVEEQKELKVVSVSAINSTGVDVVFAEAFEKDTDDVTIEILDNKGNVVEVKPITVAEGDKTAEFDFVEEQKDQEGVWTIGGVEYDFDLVGNLEAFEMAATQTEVNKALKDLGIENVKVDNVPKYTSEKSTFLTELEGDLTVDAIQNWVNKINKEELTKDEKAAIVKEVFENRDNDLLLLPILEENFERVNPDWIAEYDMSTIDKDSDLDAIQAVINNANDGELKEKEAIEKIFDRKELLEEKALLEKYATPDTDGKQTKDTKEALEAIEIQLALLDVRAATTPNRLKTAFAALDELVDKDAKFMDEKGKKGEEGYYAGYVDANAKLYFELDDNTNKVADFKEVEKAADVKAIIGNGNVAASDAQAKVNNRIKASAVTVKFVNNAEYDSSALGKKVRLLGYSVGFDLDTVDEKEYKLDDTKSVVIELLDKDDKVLGFQSLTAKGYDNIIKEGKSKSGTIDIYGEYVSASWDHEWNAEITDFPTQVLVRMEFKDGKVAEVKKDVTVSESNKEAVKDIVANDNVKAIAKSEDVAEVEGLLVDLANNEYIKAFLEVAKADRTFVAEEIVAEKAETKKDWNTTDLNTFISDLNDKMDEALTAAEEITRADDSDYEKTIATLEKFDEYEKLGALDKIDAEKAFFNSLTFVKSGEKESNEDKVKPFTSYTELKAAVLEAIK